MNSNSYDKLMEQALFLELLDQLGSDLTEWPQQHQAQAIALLRESVAARTQLARAQAASQHLRALGAVHQAPAQLGPTILARVAAATSATTGHDIAGVLESFQRGTSANQAASGRIEPLGPKHSNQRQDTHGRDLSTRLLDWLDRHRWRAAMIAALPVIAGFALGMALPAEDPASTAPDYSITIGTLAFVDLYELQGQETKQEHDHATTP